MGDSSFLHRKTGIITQRPVFYFLSEGDRTEVDYIQNLVSIYKNIVFKNVQRSHPDPMNLLKSAKTFFRTGGRLQEKDRFIIFADRDTWEISHINQLWKWEREAPNHRMFLFSNPCFELWILRHYEPCVGASTPEICHQRLIGYNRLLNNKQIPPDTFSHEQCKMACKNSKSQQNWREAGFTNVFRLIDMLEDINPQT